MTSPLSDLGLRIPVLAAPMAGGPTTPAMVVAAHRAGALGFLAAGYKTPDAMKAEISVIRNASIPFGVNLFAPNSVPVSSEMYRTYAEIVQREANRFGLTLPPDPLEDDDYFDDKIELLLSDPVPMVSFTFGIPGITAPTRVTGVIRALHAVGTTVVQTVTSVHEAELAAQEGVDLLVVQSSDAGGHFGTFTPHSPPPFLPISELVVQIKRTVKLPVIAAGGLATAAAVAEVVHAGAHAAMVGTALLRADESGASATHQAALADPARTETVITRAFTGRPARGLRNAFIDTYEEIAPLGYPSIHHLTGPLRKAAAAAGEPDLVHLWAGTGYRHASKEPTPQILARLASRT
ncbi:nitronate monooxygenase [Rhodococcus xishaensis]|uniref:Propionate 3-nitronate monooxygenase n=1 Tax=Rhodococcus xishaensis TaxID=2487364 RepID=A0A438B064_9NOCA|nr:nitronate monooxygenase [Rhodococcus xishaensis]RVW04268.1 nitronate monooxygenase [Rhodococcus xishaensis]